MEGIHEGLEAARAAGKRLGRPPAMNEEQVRHVRDLLSRPENSLAAIARLLGVVPLDPVQARARALRQPGPAAIEEAR
ncbi:hypothetical protein [Streptomonospora salina]|uniref:DNA invertase Pin-like site-specific DNA recombinase n=2 Tax=Streptomonospora salina TaxID=104205 RepID=A0A841EIP6_9ACTN|nr:hypothetical protein [Streptomonospora salina]MBB6000913.1 DNA invertase Pin-like site-specific DNA recombinase [Streptomonospora salina]